MMTNSSRMLALLGLLAVAGYQHRDKLSGLLGRFTGQGGSGLGNESNGGFLEGLQNAFGGAAPSGGGLAEALRDLVDRFTGNGQDEVARSWIETGPNRQPTAFELEKALGEDTISALTAQTGLSRVELLARLQSVLPTAVDSLTPDGRLPAIAGHQQRGATA
ncbi:MAG TPA: YidB family protein [Bauldia sp.]|nr:YidB family protein [Bauldia sp.]